MRKLIAIILTLILISPTIACADLPDISNLTFDELVSLREQLNLAIWNCQEWQEVTVPIGVWKVGEDIPAKKWTIALDPGATSTWGEIFYCSKLDETGIKADWDSNVFYYGQISSLSDTDNSIPHSIDLDCKEGMYIVIERSAMVFTPFVGKPDLGFK